MQMDIREKQPLMLSLYVHHVIRYDILYPNAPTDTRLKNIALSVIEIVPEYGAEIITLSDCQHNLNLVGSDLSTTLCITRTSASAASAAATASASLGLSWACVPTAGGYMARKSKPVSTSQQGNLFSIQDQSPNSETIEQAITGKTSSETELRSVPNVDSRGADTTVPITAPKCPQCGGPAALSLKESGKYYCQGACSYGDNFYFTI